jgi:Mg-chelatase subunit ChlI
MIMGDRGTGKSTTIRALADLQISPLLKMTPSIQIQKVWKKITKQRSENPMVELPLEPRKIEYVEQ